MTSSQLLFYYDKDYKRLFMSIPRDSVIAINKRQLDRTDVYKFSIFYNNNYVHNTSSASSHTTAPDDIKELKLKATSRKDTENWVFLFRQHLKPKRYQFQYDKDLYI